jgi:MFS family permease
MAAVVFIFATLAYAALVAAIWATVSFGVGGNAEGAFIASAFVGLLFIPMFLGAPVVGWLAARWYRRSNAVPPRAQDLPRRSLMEAKAKLAEGKESFAGSGLDLAMLRAELEFSSGLPINAICPKCSGLLAVAHNESLRSATISCSCGACRRVVSAK